MQQNIARYGSIYILYQYANSLHQGNRLWAQLQFKCDCPAPCTDSQCGENCGRMTMKGIFGGHPMSEKEPPDVSSRVRTLREERGLSMRALAERCRVSPNTISLIEREMTSPNVSTLH